MSLNGVRYQFESTIEVASTFVQLNKQQRVLGVALKRPTSVTRSQRRSNLRVSLIGIDPVPAKLVRPHPDIPGACKVDAEVVSGRIVDLSAGGAAVLVDRRSATSIQHNQHYFISFALPGLDEKFCMLGAVRHTRLVKASGSLRIGLAFRSWAGSNFDRDQRTLTQFVTRHERRMLRRRK
jgi:c-di-GMP-binding flagellar brake protein YcgR